MKLKELLMEMPHIIPDDEFGFDDPIKNVAKVKEVLGNDNKKIVEELPAYTLYRIGDLINGELCLIGKKDNMLDYYVKYETYSHPAIGNGLTQLMLWRETTSGSYLDGITKRMFFDLFKKHNCMVSDNYQTNSGRRFWPARIQTLFRREICRRQL